MIIISAVASYTNANLFDIINDNDSEINDQSDFWHFGLGIDLNFKWGDVILGGVYSVSKTDFEQSISIPINNASMVENENSRLNINRYRFIIGLEIPLLMNKVGNIITQ